MTLVLNMMTNKERCCVMKQLLLLGVSFLAVVQVFACAAITKKGTQCKREPVPGSQYCWQHGGRANNTQKAQSDIVTDAERVKPSPVEEKGAKLAQAAGSDESLGEDIGKENDALRKENQKLRRELVRQKAGYPVIDVTSKKESQGAASPVVSQEQIVDDGGWWLSSRGRRHNSKCRYYKMGKGRPCGKEDGDPCKKCGG